MKKLQRIKYGDLAPKQQEVYNFQKSAAVLAEFGFNCIKLADDWQGADFLAYHKDGNTTLKIQLKGRVEINKKYKGRDIYMNFRINETWYLVPHDELIKLVPRSWRESSSWKKDGKYSTPKPSQDLLKKLSPYALEGA
ncbi:MAG: hypothetical protein F4X91_13795 [Nitrospinae bacterium]|nr:hypothetical protein [Nitrospinota bacterium]